MKSPMILRVNQRVEFGLGLIGILTHAMNVSNITPQLTELMVLGVGVDYALFIVTRHRRNLRRGVSVSDSIVSSINTSGRAVLFAATTVCIAILGLLALGVSFFNGMAIGAAVAVTADARVVCCGTPSKVPAYLLPSALRIFSISSVCVFSVLLTMRNTRLASRFSASSRKAWPAGFPKITWSIGGY